MDGGGQGLPSRCVYLCFRLCLFALFIMEIAANPLRPWCTVLHGHVERMAVELIWINVAVPIKVLPCDTAAGGQVGAVVAVGGRALVSLLPTEKLFVSSEAFCFRQSKGRDEGQTVLSVAVLSFGVFFSSWSRSLSLLRLWVSFGVLFVSEFVLCACFAFFC